MTDESSRSAEVESITVGDKVRLTDKDMSGEVVEVREFGGKKTFVVHTEKGSRVVVGIRNIEKME